jgi:hypothetical protein
MTSPLDDAEAAPVATDNAPLAPSLLASSADEITAAPLVVPSPLARSTTSASTDTPLATLFVPALVLSPADTKMFAAVIFALLVAAVMPPPSCAP